MGAVQRAATCPGRPHRSQTCELSVVVADGIVTIAAVAVVEDTVAAAAAAVTAVVAAAVEDTANSIALAVAATVAGNSSAAAAIVADNLCRHACRGLPYRSLNRCDDLHVPASPSLTAPSPEASGAYGAPPR